MKKIVTGLLLIIGIALTACQSPGNQESAASIAETNPTVTVEAPATEPVAEAEPTAVPPTDAPAKDTATANPFSGEEAWIAYQTNRGGSEGVWLIRPDGSEDHEIAADAGFDILLPDWSPDGRRLVVASRGGENEQLYVYDLATETLIPPFNCVDFGPGCFADEPDWSPDGSKIAFINYGGGLAYSENIGGEVPIECDLTIGDLESGELMKVTETAMTASANIWHAGRRMVLSWSIPATPTRTAGPPEHQSSSSTPTAPASAS